jgi:hypothetical protein
LIQQVKQINYFSRSWNTHRTHFPESTKAFIG